MHRLIEASTSPLWATTSISVLPPGEVKFESCLGGVGNLKRHSPLFSWNTRVLSFNMGVFKQVNDQFCEGNHGCSSSLLQKNWPSNFNTN